MSFFAKLYKSQEAARERNKREQRRSDTFKFGTEYMAKCHLAALDRERRLVEQEMARIQKEIQNSPRLDFSGNGSLIPRANHKAFDEDEDDSSMSEGSNEEFQNDNEGQTGDMEDDDEDKLDVRDTILFFKNNPSVLVPILTVNGKDTSYLEEIGLVKKVVEVKDEDEEDMDEVEDKRHNANNRNPFGRRNFSNIRNFVDTKSDRNEPKGVDKRNNSNNLKNINSKSNTNTHDVNSKRKEPNVPIKYDPGTGTSIPKAIVDNESVPSGIPATESADYEKVHETPNERSQGFVPFYLRPEYDPSYESLKTETVKKYAILLRQRTPVGYRRGRYGALVRHGDQLDLLTLAQAGMQNARENVNARLGGNEADESTERQEGVRPKITKANAPSYQSGDPELYNADGNLRTCHQLPDSNYVWAEARKANYIRDPQHPVINNTIDVKDIFAKD